MGYRCPQGISLGLLYVLANKFALFLQVYSTKVQTIFTTLLPPSAALADFLYQLTPPYAKFFWHEPYDSFDANVN